LSSKPNPSSLCPLFPFLLRIVHLVHLFLSLNLLPSVSCVPEEFSCLDLGNVQDLSGMVDVVRSPC